MKSILQCPWFYFHHFLVLIPFYSYMRKLFAGILAAHILLINGIGYLPITGSALIGQASAAHASKSSLVTIPPRSHIPAKHGAYAANQVIVKFKSGAINLRKSDGESKAMAFARTYHISKSESLRSANAMVMSTSTGTSVTDTVSRLRRDPTVEYAQPNYIYTPTSTTPNDTYFNDLWALKNTGQTVHSHTGASGDDTSWLHAMDVYQSGTSNTGTIVAVIDTGVGYHHADLQNVMWDGTNCVDENGQALGGCKFLFP